MEEMKSLLNNRRLQGALVALVVALVAGATGAATATAGPVASSEGAAASSVAKTSALTAKQRKAKKRALKKCRKNRKAKKRRACIKRTNKKFNRIARRNKNRKPAKGKTVVVDVRDDYYTPNQVNVKVNDSIKWDWRYSVGSEGHNVTLTNARQLGISPFEFESPIQTGPSYTFSRKFTKPGDYRFACTLHTLMTMDVKVSR